MEIRESARKHAVEDEDIVHAVDHSLFSTELSPDEPPVSVLYLGPDRASNILEVVVVEFEDGREVVVHAMKLRQKYERLLPHKDG